MSALENVTAIVVPVYKNQPSKIELLSLAKSMDALKKHSVYFVAPSSLDLMHYHKLNIDFKVEHFDDDYFDGVDGYNKLLLSSQFYQRFQKYKYMLIYQLDALVFKDTLHEWEQKGYDYIGAPWLKFPLMAFFSITYHVSLRQSLKLLFKNKFKTPVGNGGLSLRKINSCLKAIEENESLVSQWKANEDYFWSYYATVNGQPFAKPSTAEAARFSVETNPEEAFKMIGGGLPFGAHDWESHNRQFWNNLLWRINYFGDTNVRTVKPRVSIITVATDTKNLSETLQSVRENQYDNIELVVVNSSDDPETIELMKENQDIINKWTWGSTDNMYDAMNKGLEIATGQYVWFIRAGEKIYSQSVLNRVFKNEELSDVYYGHSLLLHVNGNSNEKSRIKSPSNLNWKNFPYNRSISYSAFIAKKELVPFFDPNFTYSADLDWQIRVLKKATKVEFTGLILDEFTEKSLLKFDLKAFFKERYGVVKNYYGVFRSVINQTIAIKDFLINYLRYGRFTMN